MMTPMPKGQASTGSTVSKAQRLRWVPGSNGAKTYGTELSPIFRTLTSGVMGNFPQNNA
jgi:hypothetical protein